MVGLVASRDHCSICEEDIVEDPLVCDKCHEFVCENCVEELNDGVFCSEDCIYL